MSITAKVVEYLKTADLSRARMHAVGLPMSNQTLRRRLIAEGTSFPALVEAEKKRRCVELLANNPRADGCKIADICGYAEKNAATRAFRQWFGCTLRDYKIALRSAVGTDQCRAINH